MVTSGYVQLYNSSMYVAMQEVRGMEGMGIVKQIPVQWNVKHMQLSTHFYLCTQTYMHTVHHD